MKKEDWQSAFGSPSASFDERFRQTLERLDEKEERPMKRISFRAAAIALALILALTGAAYAASQGWMIGDYFGKRGPGNTPEGFTSGFEGDFAQEIGEIRFRIRDAYVSGSTLIVMTEISRKDGQPAIFLTDGWEESDPVASMDQMLSFEPTEKRSFAQYAQDQGLTIYHVGSWFFQNGRDMEGAGDVWAEDEYRKLVMLAQVEGVESENGRATVTWDVYLNDQRQVVDITLPVDAFREWTVEVHQTVEGLPVTVDQLTLRQSRMNLEVDIAYHLETDRMPENIPDQSPAACFYSFIHLCDPATGERLPMGSRLTGTLRWLNEERTAFEGGLGSVNGEYPVDTLRLKFYDPWLDSYIGEIDVKIR